MESRVDLNGGGRWSHGSCAAGAAEREDGATLSGDASLATNLIGLAIVAAEINGTTPWSVVTVVGRGWKMLWCGQGSVRVSSFVSSQFWSLLTEFLCRP